MITIISGTNRRNSKTAVFARHYASVFKAKTDIAIKYLSMEDLPLDFSHLDMYAKGGQSEELMRIQDELMVPTEKFFFVIPEYNGSFPGILKLFIDACSVRHLKETFEGKKASMAGLATGRAGNFRGMEHLTGILNHLGTTVMPNKLPISRLQDLIDEKGVLIDEATLKVIDQHVEEFLRF